MSALIGDTSGSFYSYSTQILKLLTYMLYDSLFKTNYSSSSDFYGEDFSLLGDTLFGGRDYPRLSKEL